MIVKRGTRGKLAKYFDVSRPLTVTLKIDGRATYDFCCFGVDADNKLSDDRYMIFYNQLTSPNAEIVGAQIPDGMKFTIKLAALPEKIQKLVFTASIDGAGVMNEISSHEISLGDKISAAFSGSDFANEKAVISLAIYRKNGWRFKIVARGFDGGLDKLLNFYGGEQSDDNENSSTTETLTPPEKVSTPTVPPLPEKISSATVQPPSEKISTPTVPPSPTEKVSVTKKTSTLPSEKILATTQKVSLEKKIASFAPKLISFVKPLIVELERNELLTITARVALVMDMSGSMAPSYGDGTVQKIINKILPVAVQFDDDGELDFWFFGKTCEHRPAVNLQNYTKAVPPDWFDRMKNLGYVNNEPVVMREIVEKYRTSEIPAYIIFVTDGDVHHEAEIKGTLAQASFTPIFWQFVGVRGKNYGVLEELDTMQGRFVDNANFFALDNFNTVTNEEFYSRLLAEFPLWLRAAETGGMLDGSPKIAPPPPPPHQKTLGEKIKSIFGF